MKRLISTMAATAALLAGPLAHAQSWQFDNLGLTLTYSAYMSTGLTPGLSLVSQSDSETVVSFDVLALASGLHAALDDNPLPRPDFWSGVGHTFMNDIEQYNVNVRDGYRITGVTVSVTLAGTLDAGQPNGIATNSFSMGTFVGTGGLDIHPVENLDGALATGGDIGGLALDGTFNLYLQTNVSTYANAALHISNPANLWFFDDASYANIGAESITLTFQTAPVPEPETYLMLSAGLALMGIAARRRRGGSAA